jgi:hypothetical protein
VCRLVPRHVLEQLPGVRHQERQDGPVRLGEGECALGGLVRRLLVTEFPVGEPGDQMSFHHREVPDDRCGAVQDIPQRAESRGRIAVGEADHRAGVADFAGA